MTTVTLKRGKDIRARSGHLWIYEGEIHAIPSSAGNGDTVCVADHRGQILGTGFLNRRSRIPVKILARGKAEIDREFLAHRIAKAVRYREEFLHFRGVYRAVYSEGDLLPGLIIDRYDDLFVLQALTLGMDMRKKMVAEILDDLFHPRAIYERSDAPVREHEGLTSATGFLRGEGPTTVEVSWAGFRTTVDVAAGQKTGMFLDQRLNIQSLAPLAPGRSVLDAFCYAGSFAIAMAVAGAARVHGVEISAPALDAARRNAALNGVEERCSWTVANAFDELRKLESGDASFGLIVLDPPTFCRGRDSVEGALRGYKEINLRALKMLEPGGFLATATCSYHVSMDMFLDALAAAAADAGRTVRIVEERTQSPDHPDLLAMPETRYLKFVILQALN